MSLEVPVWNLLHDGRIVAVDGAVPGDVTVAVEIPYIRAMLPEPGDRFWVQLSGCTLFRLHRFLADQTLISGLESAAAEEPGILSAQVKDQIVVLSLTGGPGSYLELHLRYEKLSVSLEDGRPVPPAELDDAARRY